MAKSKETNGLSLSSKINYISLIKENFKKFPFQWFDDGLVFNVQQSGYKYHLILDTGATVSVVCNERFKSYKPASCLIVDLDMDNERCVATRLETKSVNGELEYFGAVVVTGDFKHMSNIDGLIGNNFMKNRKMLKSFYFQ